MRRRFIMTMASWTMMTTTPTRSMWSKSAHVLLICCDRMPQTYYFELVSFLFSPFLLVHIPIILMFGLLSGYCSSHVTLDFLVTVLLFLTNVVDVRRIS
ncbi:hypothetical protein BJ742DRAFT_829515 [Cladochytrium replicatum]|nr:hypothetical protein BJ742DRAFT_829515 [Cladochytrium replicatum]